MADNQGPSTSGTNTRAQKLPLSLRKGRKSLKQTSTPVEASVTSMAMALITSITTAITTSLLSPIRTTLTTASNFNTNRTDTFTTNCTHSPIPSPNISHQPMDYEEATRSEETLTTEEEATIPKLFDRYTNRPIFPNISTQPTMSTLSLPGPSQPIPLVTSSSTSHACSINPSPSILNTQASQPDYSFADITIHNLCHKLTSHLHSKLFHQERAHIFRLATHHSNPPSFLQPPLDITEYRRFSPKSRARWDSWVSNFQLGLCDILREHHEDQVAEEEDDIAFQTNTIFSAYPNEAFLNKMVLESKQKALTLHQKHQNFQINLHQSTQDRHQRKPRDNRRRPKENQRQPREQERRKRDYHRRPRDNQRKPRH